MKRARKPSSKMQNFYTSSEIDNVEFKRPQQQQQQVKKILVNRTTNAASSSSASSSGYTYATIPAALSSAMNVSDDAEDNTNLMNNDNVNDDDDSFLEEQDINTFNNLVDENGEDDDEDDMDLDDPYGNWGKKQGASSSTSSSSMARDDDDYMPRVKQYKRGSAVAGVGGSSSKSGRGGARKGGQKARRIIQSQEDVEAGLPKRLAHDVRGALHRWDLRFRTLKDIPIEELCEFSNIVWRKKREGGEFDWQEVCNRVQASTSCSFQVLSKMTPPALRQVWTLLVVTRAKPPGEDPEADKLVQMFEVMSNGKVSDNQFGTFADGWYSDARWWDDPFESFIPRLHKLKAHPNDTIISLVKALAPPAPALILKENKGAMMTEQFKPKPAAATTIVMKPPPTGSPVASTTKPATPATPTMAQKPAATPGKAGGDAGLSQEQLKQRDFQRGFSLWVSQHEDMKNLVKSLTETFNESGNDEDYIAFRAKEQELQKSLYQQWLKLPDDQRRRSTIIACRLLGVRSVLENSTAPLASTAAAASPRPVATHTAPPQSTTSPPSAQQQASAIPSSQTIPQPASEAEKGQKANEQTQHKTSEQKEPDMEESKSSDEQKPNQIDVEEVEVVTEEVEEVEEGN